MGFDVITGEGVPASSLPFSPATRAGGFVFVSGQASVDDSGQIISDTFESEMRRSFENVKKVLSGAGLGLGDVVRVSSYVRDTADLPEYNRIYREIFREPYPARTTIVNCLPDTIRYEVDVVAFAG